MLTQAKKEAVKAGCPLHLKCPKPRESLTAKKQENLFGRVFNYCNLHHRSEAGGRSRPLAFCSVTTDGVIAAVHFGKPGAARAARGQGGRGGGGGEGRREPLLFRLFI